MEALQTNGGGDIVSRVQMYRDFDRQRQSELEQIADQFMEMKDALDTIKGDLEDERSTRRTYRRRAEEAEAAMVSTRFVSFLLFIMFSPCPR